MQVGAGGWLYSITCNTSPLRFSETLKWVRDLVKYFINLKQLGKL